MLGLSTYVKTTTLLSAASDRMRERNEAGQTATEYVGLIFLVAIVMGALWTAFRALNLDTAIAETLKKILGQDAATP